jgi:hypothetical protein
MGAVFKDTVHSENAAIHGGDKESHGERRTENGGPAQQQPTFTAPTTGGLLPLPSG